MKSRAFFDERGDLFIKSPADFREAFRRGPTEPVNCGAIAAGVP